MALFSNRQTGGKELKLNKNTWSYKIYCWFLGYKPSSANLCPYCRTVFLWAPLKFLFSKGFIWKLPVPAVVYAWILFEIPRIVGMFSYKGKTGIYIVYANVLMVLAASAIMVGVAGQIIKLNSKALRKKLTDDEWVHYLEHNKRKWALPKRFQKEPFPVR